MPRAGIRIFCSEQRSQGQNRERALALLRSRLYEMELEKQRAEESAKRKNPGQHLLSLLSCPKRGVIVLPCR